MHIDRRMFLGSVALGWMASRGTAAGLSILRPEDFGASGDGITNDTKAFVALSAEVTRRGGGSIELRAGRTYIVGEQHAGGRFGWSPDPVILLRSLAAPVKIIGNGARLKCQPRLRFGTFDIHSGQPVHRHQPNYRGDELATPYEAMIVIHDCRATIEIYDIELDGNLREQRIGGPFGDVGWQIPGSGIWLKDNHSSETVVNVFSHDHGQDGVLLDGHDQRTGRSVFKHLVSRRNGRQGASITGGRGYDFQDCEFSYSGHTVLKSPPCAGVDIEAEGGKTVQDLTFTRCRFVANSGVGLLAEAGPSENAIFTDCLFVGDEVWSAWPRKPGFQFKRCTFVGAAVNAFADKDPEQATHFVDCRFTDDPSLSPTGKVYCGQVSVDHKDGGPIVNLGQSLNVSFDRCKFDLRHGALLPWSWAATYRNCVMRQASRQIAFPKGKYFGRTLITAPVDLYGSMIMGMVIVNGSPMPRGPVGADVKPW